MTAIPVSAAVIRDRADALHASVDALNAHRKTCTNTSGWCARCTALGREQHNAYQSAFDAAAAIRSAQ